MNEYYNNKLVLCIGINNCLLLGMPNSNQEHASVTDRHIGTIINIWMSIYAKIHTRGVEFKNDKKYINIYISHI